MLFCMSSINEQQQTKVIYIPVHREKEYFVHEQYAESFYLFIL